MAPRGYTLNKRTGKFQAPKGSTTMAARNKSTAKRKSGTNTTANKKKRQGALTSLRHRRSCAGPAHLA
jgi:hypothetical protein